MGCSGTQRPLLTAPLCPCPQANVCSTFVPVYCGLIPPSLQGIVSTPWAPFLGNRSLLLWAVAGGGIEEEAVCVPEPLAPATASYRTSPSYSRAGPATGSAHFLRPPRPLPVWPFLSPQACDQCPVGEKLKWNSRRVGLEVAR